MRRIVVDARVPHRGEVHVTRPAGRADRGRPGHLLDCPYESSREAVEELSRTTLSAADRGQIAYGNAERVLRIG